MEQQQWKEAAIRTTQQCYRSLQGDTDPALAKACPAIAHHLIHQLARRESPRLPSCSWAIRTIQSLDEWVVLSESCQAHPDHLWAYTCATVSGLLAWRGAGMATQSVGTRIFQQGLCCITNDLLSQARGYTLSPHSAERPFNVSWMISVGQYVLDQFDMCIQRHTHATIIQRWLIHHSHRRRCISHNTMHLQTLAARATTIQRW